MRIIQFLIFTLFISLGFSGFSQDATNSLDQTPEAQVVLESPELIVLFYYADWCQPCKKLAPKLEAVEETLATDKVKMIQFNLTNSETMANAKLLALENDIVNYFPLERATGFAIVIDTETKEQVGFISTIKSNEEIVGLIEQNL